MMEHFLRATFFNDFTLFKEEYFCSNIIDKVHLMTHQNHCLFIFSCIENSVLHLANKFRIQR